MSEKATVSDATKMLGKKTVDAMKATKWWAFAQMLEDALYYGRIEENVTLPGHVSRTDIHGVDKDGKVISLRRVLKDLAHECERQALLEVTS